MFYSLSKFPNYVFFFLRSFPQPLRWSWNLLSQCRCLGGTLQGLCVTVLVLQLRLCCGWRTVTVCSGRRGWRLRAPGFSLSTSCGQTTPDITSASPPTSWVLPVLPPNCLSLWGLGFPVLRFTSRPRLNPAPLSYSHGILQSTTASRWSASPSTTSGPQVGHCPSVCERVTAFYH